MSPGHERIIIIADDLTGAADSSLPFAEAGLPTVICLNAADRPATGVAAFVSNTRGIAAGTTEARSYDLTRRVLADRIKSTVFLKIDSTLRGHPAHALAGAMRALAAKRALVAPAYPDQGRTTIHNRQRVHGQPLEQTAFGHEVQSSDLTRIFLGRFPSVQSLPIGSAALDLRENHIYIGDAETDADLSRLVAPAIRSNMPIFCGSAGLAKALARTLARRSIPGPTLSDLSPSAPVLAVIGSRHPVSGRQVEFAAGRGIGVVEPTADELIAAPERLSEKLCARLADDSALILTTTSIELGLEPPTTMIRLARIVRCALQRSGKFSLVLSGGDTAHAVAEAIGATRILLLGSIEPGIACGRWQDGLANQQIVVTKAGGFGSERSLHRAFKYLRPGSANAR